MKVSLGHRIVSIAALAAGCLCVSVQVALPCSATFKVEENEDLSALSDQFYAGDSLWSAVRDPRRLSKDQQAEGMLFDIPCPDEIELKTRTPGVDRRYDPRFADLAGAIKNLQRDLFYVTRVRPIRRGATAETLDTPVRSLLPLYASDVPGSANKDAPEIADANPARPPLPRAASSAEVSLSEASRPQSGRVAALAAPRQTTLPAYAGDVPRSAHVEPPEVAEASPLRPGLPEPAPAAQVTVSEASRLKTGRIAALAAPSQTTLPAYAGDVPRSAYLDPPEVAEASPVRPGLPEPAPAAQVTVSEASRLKTGRIAALAAPSQTTLPAYAGDVPRSAYVDPPEVAEASPLRPGLPEPAPAAQVAVSEASRLKTGRLATLAAPSRTALPAYAGDVPRSAYLDPPEVAEASPLRPGSPELAPTAQVALSTTVQPSRSDSPEDLPLAEAAAQVLAFALDPSVPPPLSSTAPTPDADTEGPALARADTDLGLPTIVLRPLPPAIAALARQNAEAPRPVAPEAAPDIASAPPRPPKPDPAPTDEAADAPRLLAEAPEATAAPDDLPEALARAGDTLDTATAILEQRDQTRAAAAATTRAQPIRLMTGDDFRPFNDRSLIEGGLMTEVVSTALTSSPVTPEIALDVLWVEGWAGRIDETLNAGTADIAFPVPKPDCRGPAGAALCGTYAFSDPMFEYFVQLFVDKRNPIAFARDSDLDGRTLCRPAGLPTHMLDASGRNWLAEGKITLLQPKLVSDCFFMLVAGEVDGVILNRFTARETILGMGLGRRVVAVKERPIAISGLHAVVRKDNPNADALLGQLNEGLARLREDGRFGEIVARHLQDIWDRL